MDRSRAKELLPIIQAFSEGKTVQYKNTYNMSEWIDCHEDDFGRGFARETEYRIKPEPREFWLGFTEHWGYKIYKSPGEAAVNKPDEIIKVREVIE